MPEVNGYLVKAALTLLLAAVGFWDARTHRIPNALTLLLAGVGIPLFQGWASMAGLLLTPALLAAANRLVRKGGGMGGGDIKLVAAAGLFLGFGGALAAVLIGCVAFLLWYALFWRRSRRPHPFGPFLAVGILLCLWLGS